MLRSLWDSFDSALRFIVAIPAGLLPRRYWRDLDLHVPVARAALASALLTFLLAFAIGVPGFVRHSTEQTRLALQLMLQETGWRPLAPGAAPAPPGSAQMQWVTAYLAAFTFAFLTPTGWLTMYLGFTGFARLLSVYVDDARGDPVLTLVDSTARRLRHRRQTRRANESREALEGPEVADRLVTGQAAGIPDAELVVIASRRKPEWTAGVFVVTQEKWYRLGIPEERKMPGGLRTFYPLTELRDQEVARRTVEYELPPLTGGARASRAEDSLRS